MKVLHVIDALRLGGAETLLANLAGVAPRAGLSMEVLSLGPPTEELSTCEDLLREAGAVPTYLGTRRTLDATAFGKLVTHIRSSAPDVVHAHLEQSATMAVPAAALAGVPVVTTFHHVHRPLTGRAAARERLAVEVATRGTSTIFCSTASLESFRLRYRPHRPAPATWRVVHNGIDLSRYPEPTDPPEFPVDLPGGDGPIVTILAALRDFKGIRHALDAWPAVREHHPTARLVIVGSGSEEIALKRQRRLSGLQDSVHLVGRRMDVPAVLAASDLVVLPSTHGENLPTVLMEAGASGRAVVASDVGGISDIVVDGVTGTLVPPGSPPHLARAVVALLDDDDLRSRTGAAARRHVERHFSADVWAARLVDVYHEAVHRGVDVSDSRSAA